MVKKVTGPKIVQKDQAGHVEKDMVGVAVVVGIHIPEIQMTTTDRYPPSPLIDSDHILTPMTDGRCHLGTLTTEIPMQDPHQSIMEEGIGLF